MKLDRRSSDFSWVDPSGPFQLITQLQADAFSTDGAFLLEEAFSAEEIREVIEAIDPIEAEAEAFLAQQANGTMGIARADEIIFSPHLVARSSVLNTFSRHPKLIALVNDLIGPNVRLYWDQLVYKKANTTAEFPWHQDNGYTFVDPQQYLTCWVALTDATADNGCPRIVPGLHRNGTLNHRWTDLGFCCLEDPDGARAVPVPAGSIAVFSSLTPHLTGPNLTDETRKAYILQFAPEGATMYPRQGDPVVADNADWQYPVSVGGIGQ